MMKNVLDLFLKILDVGEKQYVATMQSIDGEEFTIGVKATSTSEALYMIERLAAKDSKMTNMRIIDEMGNVY